MKKRELVLQMLSEKVKVVAISEALGISRVRVYEIKRGYTPYQKEYRRHFILGHNYRKDCRYCLQEKNGIKWKTENGKSFSTIEKEHPERERARVLLTEAIKKRIVIPADKCFTCHKKTDLVGHHSDYSEPLNVIWLCHSCHKKRHNQFRKVLDYV